MSAVTPRLVLIEDNPADVLLVREAIKETGRTVELVCYPDVPEAIFGLSSELNPLPDAILIDLNLPKGEGMTVVKALRSSVRLRDIPLAILTSSQSPRDLEEAQRLHVCRYIHKPSRLQQFLEKVGRAITELLDANPHPAGNG
jgi:CheY-like chemotaxis protein